MHHPQNYDADLSRLHKRRKAFQTNYPSRIEGIKMTDVSRLPGPVMDLWEWQYQGACRDAEDTLFFHPEGERGAARRRRIEQTKAICAGCPVLQQCREQALAIREPYGIWGGLSEEERSQILTKRQIALA